MTDRLPIFKARVPEWLIIVSVFAVLLSSVLLFALSTADGTAAAGYYGASAADIQFSLLMFYAAVASFAVVERRFFARVVTKDYLLICIILEILIAYWCYHAREICGLMGASSVLPIKILSFCFAILMLLLISVNNIRCLERRNSALNTSLFNIVPF
jgi:hypothetical protein